MRFDELDLDREHRTEGLLFGAGTWAIMRSLIRLAPPVGLRLLLRSRSALPTRQVLAGLSTGERATLAGLFTMMRSGRSPQLSYSRVPPTAVRRLLNPEHAHAAQPHGRHLQTLSQCPDAHH
ncbi:hypothetical protein ACTWPT_33925 [Nonomuraea sp. 3N208]|uniref:hypothetical protein n=1 Tax=Nonomuraea sp. 3N208 TaxID=3457421 RepID=UPI003FD060E9